MIGDWTLQEAIVSAQYPDRDVTVEYAFTADGQLGSLTAKNAVTGDQTTRDIYGTAVGDASPEVFRNDLLRAEIYPDSDDSAPREHGARGAPR